LFNLLLAKQHGGEFILRIEDTDQLRSTRESEQQIFDALRWLGITWSEGPDVGGPHGPYRQSERSDIYKQYTQQLVDMGHAFPCFCTAEELDQMRAEQQARGETPRYDGRALLLSKEEVAARLAAGEPHVIRMKVPSEGVCVVPDMLRGDVEIPWDRMDMQVLMKTDGLPTYFLANVVDDHLMEISHVIRGQEYLSSTPKYNLLYEAFGWQYPEYIHLPHIIREDGAKMSKRKGDPSFEDLVRMGFLPQAIVNYVALLGWNPGDEREFFLMEDLIEAFDMDRINKANAAFSIDKLRWLNAEHIRSLSPEAFHQIALPFYPEGLKGFDLAKISQLIQIRTEILTDIPRLVGFLAELSDYPVELFENQKSKSTLESSRVVLEKTLPLLEKLENWSNEGLFEVLKAFAQEQGFKVGTVMWPIRAALSGQETSPGGATELAELLGKEESLRRIKLGLSKLS